MKHLPDAALQQHIAVLGKTGSGKTFAAKAVIVEPMLEARRRVVIVDPTDAWWGLRSSRDGKGPGFPVLVLGGDHGDLPLPAAGGAAVARLAVEQGVNLVASTKHLTVGERTRWFIDFAGTISRLNRAPLHLVIDEAHNFAPQGKVPDPDTGRMLHAANTLASAGRSIGVRLVMITQRPQKLHKDALTSADTLIAMRVLAPHDRDAVKAWIDGCGEPMQGKEVLNSLAGLKRGEGWVWFPEGGHLVRCKFPEIRTFDSSATPTDGHTVKAPKAAAELDLTEINKALADAVAEAEANDPKRLRVRISELERDLKKRQAAPAGAPPAALNEEYARGRADGFEAGKLGILGGMAPLVDRLSTLAGSITETIDGFREDVQRISAKASREASVKPAPAGRNAYDELARDASGVSYRSARRTVDTSPRPKTDPVEGVTAPQQRVLNALAWWASIGVQSPDKGQVGFLAGYRVGKNVGGTFGNLLGALRAQGLIEYPSPGAARLTATGQSAARPPDIEPSTEALQQAIFERLDNPEGRVLRAIIDAYPEELTKQEAGARSGYNVSDNVGGTFGNILGRLRSLGLIEYPAPGRVVALPVLFLDR